MPPYNAHDEDETGVSWKVAEPVWGGEIQHRTFRCSHRVITLHRHLKSVDDVGAILGKQLLRCGTSVGTNVAEA